MLRLDARHLHLIPACTVRNRLRLLIRCRSFACCAAVHIVSGADVPSGIDAGIVPVKVERGKMICTDNFDCLFDLISRSLQQNNCFLRSYQADAMRNIYDAVVNGKGLDGEACLSVQGTAFRRS